MLADEYPEIDALGPDTAAARRSTSRSRCPTSTRPSPERSQLGATELRPVDDQFHGYRQGTLADPFGHQWSLSTPIAGYHRAAVRRAERRGEGYEVVRTEQPRHRRRAQLTMPAIRLSTTATATCTTSRCPSPIWPGPGVLRGGARLAVRRRPSNGHVEQHLCAARRPEPERRVGARLWFVVDDIHAAVATVRRLGGTSDRPGAVRLGLERRLHRRSGHGVQPQRPRPQVHPLTDLRNGNFVAANRFDRFPATKLRVRLLFRLRRASGRACGEPRR